MSIHDLSGNCAKCDEILNLYPGFSEELRTWFKALQIDHPELHTSCGGRNAIDQEALFARGATRAHWLQSAHNYNSGLDVFFLIDGQYNLDQANFNSIIMPALYPALTWYGTPGAIFYERCHIELKNWKDLVASKTALPVE